MIKPGDKMPSVAVKLIDVHGVSDGDSAEILGHGKVVLFALPGAFTPTCDTSHLPGFVANSDKFRALGVSRVVCATVNDHHVVKAWAERSEALGKVDFIADPHAELAGAIGLSKKFSDLGTRFVRFAMILDEGVVKDVFVQDVSGVTVSGAPAILLALQASKVSVA